MDEIKKGKKVHGTKETMHVKISILFIFDLNS